MGGPELALDHLLQDGLAGSRRATLSARVILSAAGGLRAVAVRLEICGENFFM